MKKKRKQRKQKKQDYTLLIHILFICIFILAILAFYIIGAQKNVNNLVKNTENMYKEKLSDTERLAQKKVNTEEKISIKKFQKYIFRYNYVIHSEGQIDNIIFKMPIPSDENEKQYISSLKISPAPKRTYHDGVNNIAEFNFKNVPSGKINITVEGLANLRTYDLNTAKALNKNISKEKDLKRYLNSEVLIESDDNYIKRIARKIEGKTQEEIVKNIFEYTQKNLKYTPFPGNIGALEALKTKKGKCAEYSAVMTALCRAKKIPARIVCGNIAREKEQKHNWVEVYFDKYGWVAYDPTVRETIINIYHNGKLIRQESRLDSSNAYMQYIASSRNEFSPWHLTFVAKGRGNEKIHVTENLQIKKQDKS